MKKSSQLAVGMGVGIDISSQTFDLYLQKEDCSGVHKSFTNDYSGIQKSIKFLRKNHFGALSGKIVMESTGRYHFLCAVMLKEAGFFVAVINPLIAKKYQTAQIRKCKTDKQDSKLLSQVALLEKNLSLFSKDQEDLMIRQKISTIKTLEKTIQKLKASLKNYKKVLENFGETFSTGEMAIESTLKELEKQKDILEGEVIIVIESKYGPQKIKQLKSVPGISLYLAALILFFFSVEEGPTAAKWVAFCGLEITTHESGKWKGYGRISKRGNRYLRKRLFSGGWGAYMHHEAFKNYYYQLKDSGRSHVEALNILSRKILRVAFSLLKNNTFFDSNKCF